ncbi:Uncharacterised protein [Vibrio cholerae]|nr:Uncharacterised protein [Vibrio cholerae]
MTCSHTTPGMVSTLIGCAFCALWNLLMLLYACSNACFIVSDKLAAAASISSRDTRSEAGFTRSNFSVNSNSAASPSLRTFAITCATAAVMFAPSVIAGRSKIDSC